MSDPRLTVAVFLLSAGALVARADSTSPCGRPEWTFNLAFCSWAASNTGDRYQTFTAESADARAGEIASAGFGAAITNGYHFRLNFAPRDADIRRIARTIADACHRHGLKVIEHHDWTIPFTGGYPRVFAHPDWLQLDAADMITRHRIFCTNNPQFQAAYLDYLRRWQEETNYDGYQLDEIQYLSRTFCGCRCCRDKHRRDTGRDFPPTHDAAFWQEGLAREDYRQWMRWRMRSLADFRCRISEELRKLRPDVKLLDYTTVPQSNPAGLDRGALPEERGRCDDTFGTEVNSALFAALPCVYATLKSRLALGEAHGKAVVVLNGQTPMTSYFVWAFGRTCRASLWYHLVDHADGPPQKTLLTWPYRMNDAASRSAADVAVFLSSSSRDLSSDPADYHHEYEGWLQSICLSRRDARVLLESRLKPGLLDPADVRLVVLPNARAISVVHSAALLDYVGRGGRLLLTFEAGTLDENGRPSADPLLRQAGIEPLQTLADVPVSVMNHGKRIAAAVKKIRCLDGTRVVQHSGDMPLLTRRAVGKGEIFYLAARLGVPAFEPQQLPSDRYKTTFRPPADPDAIDAIAAVVDTILDGAPSYRVVAAPRGLLAPVYSTIRQGKACRAVHLLNGAGRKFQAGQTIEDSRGDPLPMPPLPEMTIQLPGRFVRAVLATPEREGETPLEVARSENIARVRIPAASFKTYALVYVDE